jgi:hypothetical protein
MFFLAMFYYIVDGIKFSGAIIAFVSLDPLIFHLYGISEKRKKGIQYIPKIFDYKYGLYKKHQEIMEKTTILHSIFDSFSKEFEIITYFHIKM